LEMIFASCIYVEFGYCFSEFFQIQTTTLESVAVFGIHLPFFPLFKVVRLHLPTLRTFFVVTFF